MILLSNVYNTSDGAQLILGIKRKNYNVRVPCKFDLFNGEKKMASIIAEGIVLDNNQPVMTMKGTMDYEFERITLWVRERVDKAFIDGHYDAYLKEPQFGLVPD